MKDINAIARGIFVDLCLLFNTHSAFSQVAQIEDPLVKHRNYIAIQAGMNYGSPEYRYKFAYIEGSKFNLINGVFPSYHPLASIEIGHAFQAGHKMMFQVNTGLSVASYSLNMISSNVYNNAGLYKQLYPNSFANLYMTETFLQVPLAISTHIPLVINQPQARYQALELKVGGYYGINIKREIQSESSM